MYTIVHVDPALSLLHASQTVQTMQKALDENAVSSGTITAHVWIKDRCQDSKLMVICLQIGVVFSERPRRLPIVNTVNVQTED
jgi:hypothetical protein